MGSWRSQWAQAPASSLEAGFFFLGGMALGGEEKRARGLGNPSNPRSRFSLQVTLRLSGGGPYKSFVVTAVSRAKIRGAPAAVSNVQSSNATLKPAEGGVGALSNKRGPVVLCS